MPRRKLTVEELKIRIKLLNEIFENFQQITQWIPNDPENIMKYSSRAESLIEFIEVWDCGSIGGWDLKNLPVQKCKYHLYDRFLAIVKKYKSESSVKEDCGFNVDNLTKYFNELSDLRSKILYE